MQLSSSHLGRPVGLFLLVFTALYFLWFCVDQGAPHLATVGYYAPSSQLAEEDGLVVGSGASAGLRLSEQLIPDELGFLHSAEQGAVLWRHVSEQRQAERRRAVGALTTDDLALATVVVSRDGILLLSTTASPDQVGSLAREACAASGFEGSLSDGHWARLVVYDGVGVGIRDASGVERVAMLPKVSGSSTEVGDLDLEVDPDGVPHAGSVALTRSLFRHQLGADETLALAASANFAGLTRASGRRFDQPDAYFAVGAADPRPIGPDPARIAIGGSHALVFRRSEGATPVGLVGAHLLALGSDDVLQVGRTPSDDPLYTVDCAEDEVRAVGEHPIEPGDWLVAGGGVHYHVTWDPPSQPDGRVRLRLQTNPTRARLFRSLAASRFESFTRRIPVPSCDDGLMLLRGTTSREVAGERSGRAGLRPLAMADEQLTELPMPLWYARRVDAVGEGLRNINLATACVADGELRVVGRPLGPATVPDQVVPPGASIEGLAGHELAFRLGAPTFEQRLLLVCFVTIILAGMAWVYIRLTRHARALWNGSDSAFALVLFPMTALMIAGACVQMRLAASDTLLATPDYIQRHLVTGYVALTVLALAVELAIWQDDDYAWHKALRAMGVLTVSSLGMLVWFGVDSLAWHHYGPATDPVVPMVALQGTVGAGVIGASFLLLLVQTGLGLRVASRTLPEYTPPPRPAARGHLTHTMYLVGVGLLFAGWVLELFTGGRALAGYDLKLAEFAPLFLGIYFAGVMGALNQARGPFPTSVVREIVVRAAWLVALLVFLYGILRSDFGPLLVIVPSVAFLLLVWVFELHPGVDGAGRWLYRLIAFLGVCASLAALVVVFVQGVQTFQNEVGLLPLGGDSLERALDRFGTYRDPWFTTQGWWTTRGHWIAAGFFGEREVFLSNLHSDLALTAVVQSFGIVGSLLVLACVLSMVIGVFSIGERLLVSAGHVLRGGGNFETWSDREAAQGIDPEVHRESRQRELGKHFATLGYLAYFAGLYLLFELLVHVGTCFNTVYQVGITLPWVSSGGSAAVGFALLLGGTLGLASEGLHQLSARGL